MQMRCLTVRQRQRLCDLVAAGVTITAAALVVGCSRQTASKWVNRRRRGESLARSLEPAAVARPGGRPQRVEQAILRAREELREGPHVIGWALGIAASTVHAVLRRHGRSRLRRRPQPREIVRYERARPGELVHVDIKKLGRILRPGHRVTGDRTRPGARARPAGSTCSSRSTTTPASASPPSIPTRPRQRDRLPRRARPLLRLARHRAWSGC